MKGLSVFVCGLLFAVGLGMSGMVKPEVVLAFLDIFGAWDPSLAFVMAGAVLVHIPLHRWTMRQDGPVWGDGFRLPERTRLDGKLVLGAVLFGAGWGIAGICPGPALVDLAAGVTGLPVFVGAMLLGMFVVGFWERKG